MREKYLKILYWIILVCVFGIMVWQRSAEEFDDIHPIKGDGSYLLHTNELCPREDADIMIVEDEKIHLFYIQNELVNVYSTDGVFLYGIQFPHGENGVSDMHYADGLLYVDARVSGIYVFRDTELIRFELQHYQNEGHDQLEEVFTGEYRNTDGAYTYTYVAENNRIIRTGNGEYEIVIQFPQRSSHYHTLLQMFTVLVLVGCNYQEIKKRFPGIIR